jgi:hypothetical protein
MNISPAAWATAAHGPTARATASATIQAVRSFIMLPPRV